MSTLLWRQPAVLQLVEGCVALQHPPEAAEQLVRFLRMKRIADKAGVAISPGKTLENLWCWMLLNTRVAAAVHELVGGEVEHTTVDRHDTTTVERRMRALNLMRLEGCIPTLDFWEDPGTAMDSIVCVTAGGISIFLTAGMTRAEAVQSAKDFMRACVPPRARTAARAAGLLGMVANVGVDRGAAPSVGAALSAAGGPGSEAQGSFQITVKTLTGKSVAVHNLTAASSVEDLQESILDSEGMPPEDQRLIFSGRQLEEGRTLGDYRITPGCTVHLTLQLRGC